MLWRMWRLTTCYDSGGHPFLQSTNGHHGRQVWVYEEDAGTDVDRQELERLREAFAKTRLTQKHSSDELLRLQKINKSQVKPHMSVYASRLNTYCVPSDRSWASMQYVCRPSNRHHLQLLEPHPARMQCKHILKREWNTIPCYRWTTGTFQAIMVGQCSCFQVCSLAAM